MSAIMRAAFERYTAMRDEFELVRHSQWERAVAELRGELLNERGRREHVDDYSLFLGPEVRARAYASEELLEWWEQGGATRRWTVAEYEEQWLAGQDPWPDMSGEWQG